MDIFKFAIQMEKDGEKFYRDQAEQCRDEGLKNILIMLADEEVEHYGIIEQMRERADNPVKAKSTLIESVKNVFVEMKDKQQGFRVQASQADFYRKAQEIEEKSMKFYLDRAQESEGANKDIFDQLAEEERKHLHLMESLVEFVTRPDQWIENAEWHHLDEL